MECGCGAKLREETTIDSRNVQHRTWRCPSCKRMERFSRPLTDAEIRVKERRKACNIARILFGKHYRGD